MATSMRPGGLSTRDILIYLDIMCEHDWHKMYKMIRDYDMSIFDNPNIELQVQSELYSLFSRGYKVIVLVDSDFPRKIYYSTKPPFVLYYKGDLDTVEERYSYKSPEEDENRIFVD